MKKASARQDANKTSLTEDLYRELEALKIRIAFAEIHEAEWNSASILARQLETARDAGHYGGVALYRHDFLFQPSYQNSYLSAALDQLQQLI